MGVAFLVWYFSFLKRLVIETRPKGNPSEKINEVGTINLVKGERKTWSRKGDDLKIWLIQEKGGVADIRAMIVRANIIFSQVYLEKIIPIMAIKPNK